MSSMPDDLKTAYEIFTLLCTQKGISFAGMGFQIDPPNIFALGNVTERGHDLAKLFRLYADLIDQKTDSGQIIVDGGAPTKKPN